MAVTDPGRLLAGLGAKIGARRILLHVLGIKIRDPETQRLVPMTIDAKPIATWAAGPEFTKPTKPQRAACLAFWRSNPLAPDSYEWTEGGEPVLKIPKPKKSNPNPNTEETD